MANVTSYNGPTRTETINFLTSSDPEIREGIIALIKMTVKELNLTSRITPTNKVGLYYHWSMVVKGSQGNIQELERQMQKITKS